MMSRVLFRIVLLAVGLGAIEIGLVAGVGSGTPSGWLAAAIGLVLLVAGSAGFMVPLLDGRADQGGDS